MSDFNKNEMPQLPQDYRHIVAEGLRKLQDAVEQAKQSAQQTARLTTNYIQEFKEYEKSMMVSDIGARDAGIGLGKRSRSLEVEVESAEEGGRDEKRRRKG
ncbi:MAG: hypothetical protein Q9228_007685 [Teloschistes exilis]